MTDRGLAGLSIAELRNGLLARRYRAIDVVEDLLARLPAFEKYNAFATVDAEGVRMAAKASDAALASGATPGPLAGVPLSIKDVISTAGLRTAFGSRTLANNIPQEDAFAVAQLRRAGALVFAKSTTPEFGHKVLTDSPLHGATRNPWDATRSSGGSSGGAGVAVALGLGPIAISADGAGSGRIPAACCGVYGLKPTLGRVAHDTTTDLFNLVVNIGVMARLPEDLGIGLGAMAGACADDPWTLYFPPVPKPTVSPEVRGRRFLLIRRYSNRYLDPEVEAALEEAARYLSVQGATIVEFDGSKFDWALDTARRLLRVNQGGRFARLAAERSAELDPSFLRSIEEANGIDAATIAADMLARTSLYKRVGRLFEDADYFLTPTTTSTAPPVTQDQFAPLMINGKAIGSLRDEWYVYTIPANLTGHPAISIPAAIDNAGLPIGVHVVGRWGDEMGLIDIARIFDRKTGASSWAPPPLGGSRPGG